MPRARTRRPLIALILLVAALLVGYAIRAVHSEDPRGHPSPSTTSVSSAH